MTGLKLGRIAPGPSHLARIAYLPEFQTAPLPPPPAECDNTADVEYKMWCNDRLGCCTIATEAALVSTQAVREGRAISISDQDVTNKYFGLSGGQDNGLVETDVLDDAVTTGLNGEKQMTYVRLDPHNLDAVKSAINLFYGVYCGAGMPANIDPSETGLWDFSGDASGNAAPYSLGGHAFFVGKYDSGLFYARTWAREQALTPAWGVEYIDQFYACLDLSRRDVKGVDYAGLIAFQKALTG